MALKDLYQKHAALIWTVALVAPVAVVGVGLVVSPHQFWDRFLWEDIWGPTVVDAQGWEGGCWGPDGPARALRSPGGGVRCPAGQVLAQDEYTPTSEVTYGVVLAAVLYGIWHLLIRRGRIETDGWFLVALLPFIVFGPAVRSLEDGRVFFSVRGDAGFFSYVFISPWIYMQIGLYAIAALALGVFLRNRRASTTPAERAVFVGALLAGIAAFQSFVAIAMRDEFRAVAHPAWPWGGAALGLALFAWLDRRNARLPLATASAVGLPILAPVVGLFVVWATDPWSALAPGYHREVALYTLALATAATLLFYALGRWGGALLGPIWPKSWPKLAMFAVGINVAIVFGHMLDAFATFLTLCSQPVSSVCTGAAVFDLGLGGYGEKHPLSSFLLGVLNGWGFPLAKAAMVLVVIALLEKETMEGTDADRALIGLIKLAIFVLGFGPGLRDLLLVTFDFGVA